MRDTRYMIHVSRFEVRTSNLELRPGGGTDEAFFRGWVETVGGGIAGA